MTDRNTRQARGFGFVKMTNDINGEKAIAALKGKDLDGRTINVNEAHPNRLVTVAVVLTAAVAIAAASC